MNSRLNGKRGVEHLIGVQESHVASMQRIHTKSPWRRVYLFSQEVGRITPSLNLLNFERYRGKLMSNSKLVNTGMVSTAAILAATGAASAQGFDGWYSGISASFTSGDAPWDYDQGSDYDYQFTGEAAGGFFVGHNWTTERGRVVGLEIGFQGPQTIEDPQEDPTDAYSITMVDARFRAGMMLRDDVLAYGAVGITSSVVDSGVASYNNFGGNFALGVEYNVTDEIGLGVEVIHRAMNGYYGDNDGVNMRGSTGIAFRAMFRF